MRYPLHPTTYQILALLNMHSCQHLGQLNAHYRSTDVGLGEVGFATYKSGSLQALSSNVIKSNKYEDVYGGHSASIMFGYGYILR